MWRLYRFFADGGELLYVGMTRYSLVRIVEHLREQPWATEIGRWERDPRIFTGEREAQLIERAAIETGRPRYNVAHNGYASRSNHPAYAQWANRTPNPDPVEIEPVLWVECPSTREHILAIFAEADPESLTSRQIGTHLNARGASVVRTYRQDVLKEMVARGEIAQVGHGTYRRIQEAARVGTTPDTSVEEGTSSVPEDVMTAPIHQSDTDTDADTDTSTDTVS